MEAAVRPSARGGRSTGCWIEIGRESLSDAAADLPDLSGHQVYACGAPVMVESAERDFTARCGLPADAFFADSFTSEADKAG